MRLTYSKLGCKALHHLISSAVQQSHDQNWLSYQIQAHCSCFEFPCWDNGYRFGQIFMSSFNSRMVQSSAGTRADAWRWKCPKMQILVFVWLSRDALVRSGWYVTGLSIPGTKARDIVDGVGFHTPDRSEKRQIFAVSACCFMPQTPTTGISDAVSLRRIWSIEVIHWAMCSRDLTARTLFEMAHISENLMCRTEEISPNWFEINCKNCFFFFLCGGGGCFSTSDRMRK